MKMNSQNAQKIDSYIRDYKAQADLNDTEKVRIQGIKEKISVYRLPLDYFFYNVANGRFAKEYLLKQKELQYDLDPTNKDHAKIIQNMLLEQNPGKTDWLKNNLRENGQQEYGIITHDGSVINGNRRLSVLNLLSPEGKADNQYMNVARLPPNVDEKDVYKIELEKQMARDQKLDYGPINELLKIEHGLKRAHLSPAELAATIGFTEDEINDRMEKLELIREYLDFNGTPDNFDVVDDLSDHFGDSLKYTFSKKLLKQKRFSPKQLMDAKDITFALMQSKVPTKALRALPKMMTQPKIKSVFFEATQHTETNPSKVLEIFEVCQSRLKAEGDMAKPQKLLKIILGNFEYVDFTHVELKNPENKVLIDKILSYVKKLETVS